MIDNGRRVKFEQLVSPWLERLYGMAYRRAPSIDIAEDWTQETLLRAWKAFHHLSQETAIFAWLAKILHHVIADDVRQEKRRNTLAPIYTTQEELLTEHPCAQPGPFEILLSQQSEEHMLTMLDKLPDIYKDVIILRDVEGANYQQISDILDLPKGTVMSRLSRGRRHLASLILKSQTRATKLKANSDE